MSLFSRKIAISALTVLVLTAVLAQASDKPKKPKHKKDQDLSANPLANVNSKQPDKVLFDKAMVSMKKGRYDVSRLTLQTLLNTYPESEYRMRAKLAVGDTWFKEGGAAGLTQAEAEYKDFITFFPNAPEAAEAQMKVGDIYYQQMENPDRAPDNAENAEKEYRNMINMFPDSPLVPRAKQKLRDVQEVLAERETEIGMYYSGREDYNAAIARLETVTDTYPLYSKSDQALLAIGDAYAGEAHNAEITTRLPGAVRERLAAVYNDRAAQAYAKVITRYPMAPHVEDARDRLVAMNRPVPEPTEAAVAESDAEERSRSKLQFTDRTLVIIKHGPTVVEAVHVGEPSLEDPKRTLAPEINKQNMAMFTDAVNTGKPPAPTEATAPTGVGEPPRTDQPSQAPLEMAPPSGGTRHGAEIVSSPFGGGAPNDGTAGLKAVGPVSTAMPAAEKPAEAPVPINEIKSTGATSSAIPDPKAKKPKVDSGEESSSKKKKKKGLAKLNPF